MIGFVIKHKTEEKGGNIILNFNLTKKEKTFFLQEDPIKCIESKGNLNVYHFGFSVCTQ